jgi:Xaa-Pro aminopeptidase
MSYQELLLQIETHNLDYYLLATKCEFDVEYLPDYAKNLEKITGFNGSNGFCFLSENKIIFITDGRYLLQAEQQLKKLNTECVILNNTDIDFNLQFKQQFLHNVKVGFNPKILTENIIKKFQNKNIEYIPAKFEEDFQQKNNINKKEIFIYDEKFSGENHINKISKFAEKMQHDFYFFNNSASLCWLLNIKGFDISDNLIFLCYGILEKNTKTLTIFCHDLEKLNPIKTYQNIKIKNIFELDNHLNHLLIANKIIGASDQITIYYLKLLKENLKIEEDYCKYFRSYKNEIEIGNAKKIHLEDAIAFMNFWYFFEKNESNNIFDELKIAAKLENFRKKQPNFICNSFETIAGFKENGAIIHYKPTTETSKKVTEDGLLLIDSGGHYYGGTTDVTRVLSIGKPTNEEKFHYTLVLKTHLKLLDSYFPKNTYMHQLNSIARYILWQKKLDFSHGLGHGVSNCIDVHEAPYSINNRCAELLIENLILSNEPGLYFENQYGIRIENLIYSKIINNNVEGKKQFIKFENLTMIPYETKLIEKSILDQKEIMQINDYHEEIFIKLQNILDKNVFAWMKKRIEII